FIFNSKLTVGRSAWPEVLYIISEYSFCYKRVKSTLMFKMATFASANYGRRQFDQCFLWNVQPAGTMLLHMIMMIYGKLWSLLCHYLLDKVYMKAVLNGPTFNGQWSNVTVVGMDYVVFVLLNPASKAVAALFIKV
ncbi:hypothetical protein T4E_3939, partial [Trichinella pseudospiralis]